MAYSAGHPSAVLALRGSIATQPVAISANQSRNKSSLDPIGLRSPQKKSQPFKELLAPTPCINAWRY